ncbi:MAG: 6,7-dimethyl-8-ribityllumazine synthase [Dehalococcoidia bacterium]
MNGGEVLDGSDDGTWLRVAIVVARFNDRITDGLLEGAREVLLSSGVEPQHLDVFFVPGSFELPLTASTLAVSRRYGAVICLGAIIKHETRHDEYIAHAVAQGLTRASLESGVPVVFGVLTTDNVEQAVARSSGDGNRGRDAARTAVRTANLLRQIRST